MNEVSILGVGDVQMSIGFRQKDTYKVEDLLEIMRLLRSPEGCPWDREQTHQSIRRNLIEETYEVCEAIDNGDTALLCEELGDVLLQVVFHAGMESERGTFDFDDVCDGICKKLIIRHPHIFSDVVADTADEVLRNWDEIKKSEKGHATQTETLKSVSRALPSLMRSEKVQARAAKTGFDYDGVQGAMADLRGEVEELSAALESGTREEIADELGDVLFSAVNVGRFAKTDCEQALSASCDKFISRFQQVESLAGERGVALSNLNMDELNDLWREAKIKVK